MGLAMKIILVLLTMVGSMISYAEAAWQGPTDIVNLGWGNKESEVAITYGDTEDDFPHSIRVDSNGNIVIADSGNTRLMLFSPSGNLTKIITPEGFPTRIANWPLQWEILGGERIFAKRRDKYQVYDYQGNLVSQFNGIATYIDEIVVLHDNSILVYKSDVKTYYQYSPTGQLIKTYTERPLELGVVGEQSLGDRKYKVTITYPDKNWLIIGKGRVSHYLRDKNGNLYGYGEKQAIRYNSCGKELARLTIPNNQIEEKSRGPQIEPKIIVMEEYGPPVIAPNGDVYTWKRTPDKYSILKWTWVDDKKAAHDGAPSEPEHLSAKASSTGIQLTWKDHQDPGCITGYEISRSTSWKGPYTAIATVNPDTRKYEDTSANADTTYFYKVRAVAGSEYSDYTSIVSTKR